MSAKENNEKENNIQKPANTKEDKAKEKVVAKKESNSKKQEKTNSAKTAPKKQISSSQKVKIEEEKKITNKKTNKVKETEKEKKETKEEQVVFKSKNKNLENNEIKKSSKNSDLNKTFKDNIQNKTKNEHVSNNKPQKEKKINNEAKKVTEKEDKTNKINTEEFFEEKDNHRRKVIFILINIITILIILMIFSTIFAIFHTMKPTIANGVKIKNIDVSGLTYNEAQEKLEEAFNVCLNNNLELKHSDYSYIIKSSDISLVYNLHKALDEAYSIGRKSNIINSNYSLIKTAILKKNIDFKFEYNAEELDKIIDEVALNIPGLVRQCSHYIEGSELIIKPGADGIQVKKEELKNLIINNIQNRNPLEIIKDFKNTLIEIPCEEAKAEGIDIEKIYNEIYSEPKDAYYTEKTETTDFAVYADVDGVDFAISKEEAKNIISEPGKEEYSIPLNRKKANVTIDNLGIEVFPYLVGSNTTNYDPGNLSRSENLRIAVEKINGKVIMPGKQFSFNEVVGERTVAEGYKDAKIYADGRVVDGLAGGICQVSSTLYNAVLDGNLQVDERSNHSFVTSYLPAGRDATVVYGVKDFKFTNNRKFPIKIEATVMGGVITFKIYGIQEEKEYKVNIIPVITDSTPFTTQTITDYSLAPGKTWVDQAGANGCKVTTYKEVSLNGIVVSKEVISNDTYKVMTRIVRVGPQPTTPTVGEQ